MATLSFAGYAALFDLRDNGGDILRRGAFAAARSPLPLLWQHQPDRRIGTITTLREDGMGLFVTGEVDAAAGCPAAVAAMIRDGRVSGLSFGYRVRTSRPGIAGRGAVPTREISALDLIEISIVNTPMQPAARIDPRSLIERRPATPHHERRLNND